MPSFEHLGRKHGERMIRALKKLDELAGKDGETFDNIESAKVLLAEAAEAFIELADLSMEAVKILGCAKIMVQEGPLKDGDELKYDAFDKNFAEFVAPYAQALHAVATMAGVKLKPLPHPFCDDDEPKGTIQ